ncbi:MAG: ABC transporter permease [Xanthomonadales bacterium]|nr:ABC transporter permease [Xanthomonadales bacterium]
MQAFWFEWRTALRSLRSQPWFSALVVLVLAGGLGCVLFMLAAINGMVWQPLPFPNADRLLVVGLVDPSDPQRDADEMQDLEFLEARQRLSDLGQLAGYSTGTINLSDSDRPERFSGGFVTANFFDTLGVPLALGQGLQTLDEAPNAPLSAVISHRLWQSRYQADPQILGRVIRANGREARVVGVAPANFSFPQREDLWLPQTLDPSRAAGDAKHLLGMIALDSPANRAELEQRLQHWQSDRVTEQGATAEQRVLAQLPLAHQVVDRTTRNILNVMLAAVILVQIVACANAANLLLSRTLARSGELSLRAALGAGRRRLAIQMLMQSLLLGALATVLGLLLANVGLSWLTATLRASEGAMPLWMRFEYDGRMLAITLTVALLTGVLTAVVPALRASRVAISQAVRETGRGSSGGWFNRIARGLVIVEVGLSCALLILAGMMVRAVANLSDKDLGVDGQGLLTARLGLFDSAYPTPEARLELFKSLGRALREAHGVQSAALSTALPAAMSYYLPSHPVAMNDPGRRLPYARVGAVDEAFLQTWGVRLLQGRGFDGRDRSDTAAVAIIDRTYAEQMFPGTDPLGQLILVDAGQPDQRSAQVVGVVDALMLEDPEANYMATVLLPLSQYDASFVSVAVRTLGDPLSYSDELAAIMRQVDPDTPLYWIRDFDQVFEQGIVGERITSKLFATFGLVALILAGGGLYGVVAFSVTQRTRELGVRRALGAPTPRLLRSLLGRSSTEVTIGITLGLALGIVMTMAMAGIVGDMVSVEVWTCVSVVALLVMVTATAVLVPARRALAVDPMVALRSD